MKKYLEAGRLTSLRGIKGEVRFDCWCDSPDFLKGVNKFYFDIDGKSSKAVELYRSSVPSIIFDGYETREAAAVLVGKTIYFDRENVKLPEGVFYNDDLIGLAVFNVETDEKIGVLTEIIYNGATTLYKVADEQKSFLIPAIKEFIVEVSIEKGVTVKLIDGLDELV